MTIPEEMDELSLDEGFAFSCYPGISCFNACCRDLHQFLTPYDVLRLKRHFSMSSASFLERYTARHTGPQTGLPVVTLKPGDKISLACPFVTSEGCSVYADRPSSCRIYPIVRVLSRSRQTKELSARYMLLQEPHCNGFSGGSRQTVREWMESQGLGVYNAFNDAMMTVIAMKNQCMQAPLPAGAAALCYTACYDLDRFRELLAAKQLDLSGIAQAPPEADQVPDEQVLRFSLTFVREKIRQCAGVPAGDADFPEIAEIIGDADGAGRQSSPGPGRH